MPNNMISRIQAVKSYGMQYYESASLKQKKNDIEAFTPHFIEAQRCLTRTLDLMAALSNLGRTVSIDKEEIRDALSTVHTDLNKGTFNPWNAEKLKNAINKAEKDCLSNWRKYISERIDGTKSILQSIQSIASEEEEYKALKRAENRIANSKPCSEEATAAIDSYLHHFNKLIDILHLDAEVLAFLKELTDSGSVPLGKLTQTCLEKLQGESFTNKLKIIIQ